MKNYCLVFLFIVLTKLLVAQVPKPQDCLGAIPICKNSYDEPDPYSYSGEGNYKNEIQEFKDCITPESNGVWYIFTAQSSGVMRFSIKPHQLSDDYDWIVFDLTKGSCADLSQNAEKYVISSNNFGRDGVNGYTGANSDSSGGFAGSCNGPGDIAGPPWNDDINVKKGNTYVLYLSNWTGSKFGYFIDFSNSSASIFDNFEPELDKIIGADSVYCGENLLNFNFTENVKCDEVTMNTFSITRNDTIVDILKFESAGCALGSSYTKQFGLTTSVLNPGIYSLNLKQKVSDICGNKANLNHIDFLVHPIDIEKINKQDVACFGESSGSIQIQAKQGNMPLEYSVDNGTTYQTSNTFKPLMSGKYTIAVKNKQQCVEKDTISIFAPLKLETISVNSSNIKSCFGASEGSISATVAGGTGNTFFSIDNGNSYTQSAQAITKLKAGKYKLKIKDDKGCTVDGNEVELFQPIEIQFNDVVTTDITCYDTSDGDISFAASGGTGNLLFALDTAQYQTAKKFKIDRAGNYQIWAKDSNGCTKKSQPITVNKPDSIDITRVETLDIICDAADNSGHIVITASGGNGLLTYILNDSIEQINNSFEGLTIGKYWIEVTDEKQCLSNDSVVVTLVKAPCLIIPKIISPNNDGMNDTWQLIGAGYYPQMTVQVFDRWHKLIFESIGAYQPWDGTFNGEQLLVGSYFYVINIIGDQKPFTGFVTLVR